MNTRRAALRKFISFRCRRLYNLQLERQFLPSDERREIKLPKLPGKAEARPMLVEVDDHFHSERAPQIGETHVKTNGAKLRIRVIREGSAIGHEASE